MALLATVIALHALGGTARPLQVELAKAYKAAGHIGYCVDTRPKQHWDERATAALQEYQAAYFRAALIMGPKVDYEPESTLHPQRRTPDCSERAVASAEQQLTGALNEAHLLTDAVEMPLGRGLWVGLFPLCKQTVESASVIFSGLGDRVVRLRFAQPYDTEFKRYTGSFLDKSKQSHPVAVRLNGRILSRPMMYDALSEVDLSGPDDSLPSMAAAARSDCPVG